MLKTLKELCALPGVSGREDKVREYIIATAEPYADEIKTDAMGNVLVFKKGLARPKSTVMLAAHMDEVGVIINEITEDGYLKFDFIGGIDRRVVIGKKVYIGEAAVPGILGIKAFHLVDKSEEDRIPKVKEMYIDIGANNREEAEAKINIGDVGCFDPSVVEFGEGYLKAKAIDDRIGCTVMLELIASELPVDTWFAFTVQEEVGCRGAFGAAFALKPEIALVIEGTTAADLPSQKGAAKVCIPGNGPVVPFMDGGAVYDRKLFERLRDLAVANDIPWQTKTYISGGTDAQAIQRSRAGVRVAAISAALRYIHSPSSVGCLRDFDNMLRLARLFLEDLK
ncbi:MAG: M42 family metallopeptidase [Clostridiales bacterium]|nr:M42 family metallopeptidase [Clostridiales bacterium]